MASVVKRAHLEQAQVCFKMACSSTCKYVIYTNGPIYALNYSNKQKEQ